MPIVTLSTKGNVKLTKQLNERFKRPIYLNEYKTKLESKNLNNDNLTRFYLDASFQGVRRLFVLAFNNTTVDDANNPVNDTNNRVLRDSHRKYFFPRVDITDYNVLIDGRIFMVSQLMIKLKIMMRLEKLQQDKVMIMLEDVC